MSIYIYIIMDFSSPFPSAPSLSARGSREGPASAFSTVGPWHCEETEHTMHMSPGVY